MMSLHLNYLLPMPENDKVTSGTAWPNPKAITYSCTSEEASNIRKNARYLLEVN